MDSVIADFIAGIPRRIDDKDESSVTVNTDYREVVIVLLIRFNC